MRQFLKSIIVSVITLEAKLVLKKYRPKIVVVTGSVGKTSTKDAVFTVLSHAFYVRKSEKSFNSDIGVPLTILGCPNGWNDLIQWARNMLEGLALIVLHNHYPKWLVLEVGADRPGDIERIMRWVVPTIVVTTRFPDIPVHVEFYTSPEDVVKEELLPVQSLQSEGFLVANADDPNTKTLLPLKGERLSYGFSDSADFVASHEHVLIKNGMPLGMQFRVSYKGSSVPITLTGVLGTQHVYPALAAIAVGASQGINVALASEALGSHEFPPARMRLIPGKNGSVIIDDTYNSSPVAVEAALAAFAVVRGRAKEGRNIAILGDMLELGTYSVNEHKRVGALAAEAAHMLMTVGVRARDMAVSAKDAGMKEECINIFDASVQAAEILADLPQEGDIILVKGSQGVRMERIVEAFMAHPEEREKLLARQEEEWRRR